MVYDIGRSPFPLYELQHCQSEQSHVNTKSSHNLKFYEPKTQYHTDVERETFMQLQNVGNKFFNSMENGISCAH